MAYGDSKASIGTIGGEDSGFLCEQYFKQGQAPNSFLSNLLQHKAVPAWLVTPAR